MENIFLTVQEVATLLKISELTVYKYIRDLSLEAIELGGHYRISNKSLLAFLETHKVKNNPIDKEKEEQSER